MVNATSHHSHPRSIHSQSTVNAMTMAKQRRNNPSEFSNNPKQSTNNAKQSINFKKQCETTPQLEPKGGFKGYKSGVKVKKPFQAENLTEKIPRIYRDHDREYDRELKLNTPKIPLK